MLESDCTAVRWLFTKEKRNLKLPFLMLSLSSFDPKSCSSSEQPSWLRRQTKWMINRLLSVQVACRVEVHSTLLRHSTFQLQSCQDRHSETWPKLLHNQQAITHPHTQIHTHTHKHTQRPCYVQQWCITCRCILFNHVHNRAKRKSSPTQLVLETNPIDQFKHVLFKLYCHIHTNSLQTLPHSPPFPPPSHSWAKHRLVSCHQDEVVNTSCCILSSWAGLRRLFCSGWELDTTDLMPTCTTSSRLASLRCAHATQTSWLQNIYCSTVDYMMLWGGTCGLNWRY